MPAGAFVTSILPSLIGAGAGAAGMFGQRRREDRSFRRQKEMMGIQFRNQQHLNQQGHDLQYDMWKKTNYPSQMSMLKEAGLNPALMYGMGGQGGMTTGNQGGGSAASGNAPQPQPMELGTAMQAALLDAQRKNIEADTKNKEAETAKIAGVDTEETKTNIGLMLQDVKNKKAIQQGQEIENLLQSTELQWRGKNLEQQLDILQWQAKKLAKEVDILNHEEYVAKETRETRGSSKTRPCKFIC